MTRSAQEVEAVLYLAERGLNSSQIARLTRIPRPTIGHWLAGRVPGGGDPRDPPGEPCVGCSHTRPIELADWQREILDRHPWAFLRGLIHSDGSRFMNPAVHPHRTYWYPRYQLSNRSADIRSLFCEYCDRVGVEWRQANRWNISVARRASVELMDRHIGPKR